MRKTLAAFFAGSVGLAAQTLPAHTRSTGWVDGYEWTRIAGTLAANGEMPVSVECKDTKTKSLSWKSGVANVEIQKNPENIDWHWAFGDQVPMIKRKLEKAGFKLVSYSEYRRASGLKIPCAIWHKKKVVQ